MPDEGAKDQLKPTGGSVEKNVLEPIGDVIIGKVDPRTLSRKEFERSPELLFHGAESAFIFLRKLISGPNSQTIGRGFYVTDDRRNAEFYSSIRKHFKGDPVCLSLLPYAARMLDLRSKNNSGINSYVSIDFQKEYRDFVVTEIKSIFPDGVPDYKTYPLEAARFSNLGITYRSTLNELIFGEKPVELRQMLSLKGNSSSSEFGSGLFSKFMLGKGYDGLIYNEGGDHPDQKHTTSFVFYNLNKIGTYETWHQDEMK